MTSESSKSATRLKNKRPDSMKLELLKINHEESLRKSFIHNEHQVKIGFKNLSYSIYEGIFRNKKRNLLREINGEFNSGEMTAIMGPSGSGKSTLMNILAGYTSSGVSGSLLMNNDVREEESFRAQSCYIMQDDNLQPLLTVMESMIIAANLKLDINLDRKEKRKRIKEILEALALWECRKVRTQSLSGGQRKRLAIALELLKNPQIMFFDEPTSGLDSVSTKQCIMLLKKLALEGKTVVCTIHQPSASVFELFDHLYAIAEGTCVYQGSIKGLLPYLEEAGLKCPPYNNPADYLLEVTTGEYGLHNAYLMEKSENGRNCDWRKNQRDTIDSLQIQSIEHIDKMMQSGLLTPVKAPKFTFTVEKDNNGKRKFNCCFKSSYSTSFFYQLYILLKRSFLILSRDRTLTYSRVGTHLLVASIIGVLYYRIGEDASNVLNNFNYMFFTLMFFMLTAFNCVVTTFPSELPILVREHFNKWYSLTAYYLAITLADLPVQILSTLLYSITTYYLTSQPIEGHRIVLFLIMCILVSLVSQSFGLFIGACMDVKTGVIFGPFCLLPFVIFSGFFVQLNNAHPYLQWLFHISFLKYGFEGLMLSIFGYDRGKIPCNADYCHFVYSKKFLEEVDMENAVYEYSLYFLLGLIVILRLFAFIALLVQTRRKR